MRVRSVLFLMHTTMRGKRLRNVSVVGGLAVGMLALGLSTIAGLGTTRSLQRHLTGLFPEQRIVLRPATVEALFVGEKTTITDETVAAVEALPGVVRVGPEAVLRFPASGKGQLLGKTYGTDMSVTGIPAWLLGDEAPEDFSYDPEEDAYLPTVLSQYFLDLYNSALAESNSLPRFSRAAIVGRHLELILGVSTIHPAEADTPHERVRVVPAEIVALTRNPDLLGLLAPIETVEAFNAWWGFEDKQYRALHVELATAEDVENIKPAIAKLDLAVHDRMAPWRKALILMRLVGFSFVGLGVLVFGLALAYLVSAVSWMLSERRRELALFRALGATPRQVAAVLGTEVGLTSLLGIVLGLGAAWAALHYANGYYIAWRADRAFLPPQLFDVPWWWMLLLGALCWGVAMGLSLKQVTASSRVPISHALTQETG